MNNFTNLIQESRKNYDSGNLLASEIAQYLNKVNKKIPQNVQEVIYLTKKYNLLDAESIDKIRLAHKGSLKNISQELNIPILQLEDMWKMLKEIKNNYKLLPQYQSPQERESIMLGQLSMNDLTIDLDSVSGRNAAAKMYMPMVYKIVNQYMGKSSLNRQELMSAGLQGLTDAMNEWKREEKEGEKKVAFKTYAAYRIQQQILNDINDYSHALSGVNSYAVKKFGTSLMDAISLDGLPRDDNGDFKQDHINALGTEDKTYDTQEEKHWESLYKLIENNFKNRDVDIFYRYFGLNGYKREKSKDIAKSMNMSEGNIRNSIINKIITFLKRDKKASDILTKIQDNYNESLMVELWGMDKDMIIETLINDDIFILLEELNRWNNKDVFKNALKTSLYNLNSKEKEIILNILNGDFNTADDHYKTNKKIIVNFLNNMYPAESMSRKTDVSILEYMEELQNIYQKYK